MGFGNLNGRLGLKIGIGIVIVIGIQIESYVRARGLFDWLWGCSINEKI